MNNFNAADIKTAIGAGYGNQVESGELVIRQDTSNERLCRVLWLSSETDRHILDALDGIPCFRLEVDLAPVTVEDWSNEQAWEDQIRPTMLRLGALELSKSDRQYRLVQPNFEPYSYAKSKLQRILGPMVTARLLGHNYLPEIDWRRFFQFAERQEDRWLVCPFTQCRQPVAALGARINRSMEARPSRRYSAY